MNKVEVSTVFKDNIQQFDWRSMNLFNRIKVGLTLILFGKVDIRWGKMNIEAQLNFHDSVLHDNSEQEDRNGNN